ncbi:MAG: hypothetical protein MUP98_04960, partial [Candidatus Aminicenantes bacterium]|nr:hypothetical protein [Candidatus Aminicenantes bacterium]
AILVFSLTLFAQEIQHEAVAINIEVPVRVFKGNTFIDNLTIDDFEIYEEGVLQEIEAIYFIRKTEIMRTEIKKPENEMIEGKQPEFTPDPSRTFVLMFEIIEYLPKIGEVLDYFFERVIRPGDSLIIATPVKTYNLNSQALERVSHEEIAKQLKGKLRTDANLGSSQYRSQLNFIKTIDENDGSVVSGQDKKYTLLNALRNLKQLMYFDENRAVDFANFLKKKEGQKHVFFFFQKTRMPIPKELSDMDEMDLLHDISLDSDKLKNAFADSSISCNFLYITKTISETVGQRPRELQSTGKVSKLMESSMDSFRGFSEIAEVTGGLIDSSANASASFERAVDYSESYYLLYYSPKNYKADGKFREIKVKVKGQNYRITHRTGYVAD